MGGTVERVPIDWGDDERRLTDSVSVLVGDANGAYPSGNSLLVRGRAETVIIDPSVTVVERGGAPVPVDAVINSHSHEDHVAGNGLFADARVHVHAEDLARTHSLIMAYQSKQIRFIDTVHMFDRDRPPSVRL